MAKKTYPPVVDLTTELENMDNPERIAHLGFVEEIHYETIKELWDGLIFPVIKKHKDSIIEWKNFLCQYILEDDAVFAIRNFSNGPSGENSVEKDKKLAKDNGIDLKKSNNPFTLRRGFYTQFNNNKISYFFTDNFFAAYFLRMALDDFIPKMDDFKKKLLSRTFPARFSFSSTKQERDKAAFSIEGKQGIGSINEGEAPNPKFQSRGYKISHIIDSGMNFRNTNSVFGMASMCKRFFPRGVYEDWNKNDDFYVRKMDYTEGAKEYLQAHFLRFACPMNYILTPLANKKNFQYQVLGENCQIDGDIGELKELQQYAMIQYKKFFGQEYDDFLSKIMFDQQLDKYFEWLNANEDYLANIKIDLTIQLSSSLKRGLKIEQDKQAKTSESTTEKTKSAAPSNAPKIGQYVKSVLTELIPTISDAELNNLMDKAYCSRTFGLSYPAIVEEGGTYNKKRFYKDIVTRNGVNYHICSQFIEENREGFETWNRSYRDISLTQEGQAEDQGTGH